jgi:hypothetical protein
MVIGTWSPLSRFEQASLRVLNSNRVENRGSCAAYPPRRRGVLLRDALHKTLVRAGYDAHIKIIAMSGKSDDYLSLADKFGTTTVLAKPFSGTEVLAVVAAVLAGSFEKDV